MQSRDYLIMPYVYRGLLLKDNTCNKRFRLGYELYEGSECSIYGCLIEQGVYSVVKNKIRSRLKLCFVLMFKSVLLSCSEDFLILQNK